MFAKVMNFDFINILLLDFFFISIHCSFMILIVYNIQKVFFLIDKNKTYSICYYSKLIRSSVDYQFIKLYPVSIHMCVVSLK